MNILKPIIGNEFNLIVKDGPQFKTELIDFVDLPKVYYDGKNEKVSYKNLEIRLCSFHEEYPNLIKMLTKSVGKSIEYDIQLTECGSPKGSYQIQGLVSEVDFSSLDYINGDINTISITIKPTKIKYKSKTEGFDILNDENFKRWEQCAKDPIHFIETYLNISNTKTGQQEPFKLFEYQKELINSFINNERVLINRYRQAGLTSLTSAFATWCMIFKKDYSVGVHTSNLGGKRYMEMVSEYIQNLPDFLKIKMENEIYGITFENGNEIKVMNLNRLRGCRLSMIIWDDVAFCKNQEEFMVNVIPSLASNGKLIANSTPKKWDHFFPNLFNSNKQEDSPWESIQLYWFNDPRYNKDLTWQKGSILGIIDDNFSPKKRLALLNDGWKPTSPSFKKMCEIDFYNDKDAIDYELWCRLT